MIVLFLAAVLEQLCQSIYWGHNNWCMNECLINYAGGFVRRGIFGQLAMSLSGIMGIQANIIVILICMVMLVFLLGFFCWKSKDRFPLIIIFSPIVLGGPVFQDYLMRKDTVCIVLLIACLLIEKTKFSLFIRSTLINIIGISAILSHEGFIFYGFAGILVMRYFSEQESILKSAGRFSPMILAFVLSSLFHGDETTAIAINNSLIKLWHQIDPTDTDIYNPSCAVYSLKYTLGNCPWMGYSVLSETNYHVYTPLAWIGTVLVCFVYLLSFLNVGGTNTLVSKTSAEVERTRLFVILSFQLIAIFPLFIIGWDYGRWIFLWTSSSLAIYFIGLNWSNPLLERATLIATKYSKTIKLPCTPQEWHLLVFGIPLCSWSVFSYLESTPFGYQLNFLLKLFTHRSLFDTIYPFLKLQE